MIFKGKLAQTWEVTVEGTYGEFTTPAGQVDYLMTKAKLGRDTDNESRLTRYLAPVREVLNVEEMDFNQLLQRDLDDYRVATDLVDYLLKPKMGGPAFYTPILVALLPFDGTTPVDCYPPKTSEQGFTDASEISWHETQYGDAFRVLKLAEDPDGKNLSRINLGRLEFNTTRSRLVVIDGQHRAMALLAVRRTIDQDWETGAGSRYRYFYEKRIKEILKNSPDIDLQAIEFPVCICWFPDTKPSQDHFWPNPHQAARKLFVDVNQNARKPNKSRLVLLSDTELIPIFVRSLLNRLRQADSPFPLHIIEYDYPHETGESSPVRPLALANVLMLQNAVKLALSGPDKYIRNVALKIGGRPSLDEGDSRLRRELEVRNWLTKEIQDEGISESITLERENLGNTNFPRSRIDELVERFQGSWGNSILQILSNFFPYKCHIEAVKSIEDGWRGSVSHGELAREAMFKGLGIYWTLRADYEQWIENDQIARQLEERHDKTDTVQAWQYIQDKEEGFAQLRAQRLFEQRKEVDEKLLKASENSYATLRSQAFLSGAVLTLASLKDKLAYSAETFQTKVPDWIDIWSQSLKANSTRIHLFDRRRPDAFFRFNKLEPHLSVYFRYGLLELMSCFPKSNMTDDEIEAVRGLVEKARWLYLQELTNQQVKALKKQELDLRGEALEGKARDQATEQLQKLCKTWFNIKKDDFDSWFKSTEKPDSASMVDTTDDLDVDSES